MHRYIVNGKTFVAVSVLGFFLSLLANTVRAETPLNTSNRSANNPCTSLHSTYQLGPGDQLELSTPGVEDFDKKLIRIDEDGKAQVPLIGRALLAGLTVPQAEKVLNESLSAYIRDPQISIDVKELRSQPVSVLGAVNTPGVHQLEGRKSLLEVLSLAGGIRPDGGYSIHITRQLNWGCIPLPNAHIDSTGRFSTADLDLKKLIEAKDPGENIQIFPNDVVTVSKAEMVYVIGDVKRSGGFTLGEDESISVLQALSLAEGLIGTADGKHAKILRVNQSGTRREEITVNVNSILKGSAQDIPLHGEDILFIPGSTGKKMTLRGIEAAIQTGTGIAIWH